MKKKYLPSKTASGFKVPENYFEEFEDRLFEKVGEEAWFLTTKEASGFGVPQNYFETFEIAPPKTPKVIPLFTKKQLFYAAGIAAAVLLVFSIFDQQSTEKVLFSTLEQKTIENYIDRDEIDFFIMGNILEEDQLTSELEFNNLDKEVVFDYLMEHANELSYVND